MKGLLLLLAAVVGLVGCGKNEESVEVVADVVAEPPVAVDVQAAQVQQKTPTLAEDVAAIKSLNEARITANKVSDAVAFAALFTDDAIIIRGSDPVLIGKEAIQSEHRAHHDKFNEKITGELVEIEVFGDWAFDRGSTTIKLIPKDGSEPTGLTVRRLDLLKRQPDGSWKYYRQLSNELWDSKE